METNKVEEKKIECYCCNKSLKEGEGDYIAVSKKEKRLVCKKCNHLPKYEKTPMDIIREAEKK